MSIGIFKDKTSQPSDRDVLEAIGGTRPLWESLEQFVLDHDGVQGEFKYYGKNYGWAVRFKKSGKALLSLYPGEKNFTVQLVLGQKEFERSEDLNLGKKIRNIIAKAHPYPEGRWLYIKVKSKRDATDVEQLLLIKVRSRKGKVLG
jgi:hypothetical protein